MDYLVLARKYRPQTFAEVAGQGVVARTLTNAITSGRVAHAYLFTGPRGVGKTSTARILAKALCCETGATATPCGTCDQCRQITDGSHPDVVEVDAARFGGKDDVKDLLETAHFAPTMARMRIFVLDEVHMLSPQAWNALLKVLEEPPAHVRFIFATTEADKVLPTVLSRCQRFDFRPIEQEDIVKRLREVCAGENVTMADALLHRIARAAGGGMRDAQTLLDQLIAVSDGGIAEDDLTLLLGAARGEDLYALVDGLLGGDGAASLAAVDRALAGGVAPSTLLDQLVDHTRLLLLVQTCGPQSPAVQRLGTFTPAAERQAKAATPEKLLRFAQILTASQIALRQGVDARLQLELACVRIAGIGQMVELDTLMRRLERLEQGLSGSGGTAAATGGPSARPR